MDKPRLGHFCFTTKCQFPKVHLQVATLASNRNRCLDLSSRQHKNLLFQPPMETNCPMVGKVEEEPSSSVSNNSSLLGFSILVAPTSETAQQKGRSIPDRARGRFISGKGGEKCQPQVAPDLSHIIRVLLERKQTSPESTQAYLEQLGNLDRYNSAFSALWHLCIQKGLDPYNMSEHEVAQVLLLLNVQSQAQARNDYLACLLIPGLEQLRFNALLRKCRQQWNTSKEKYAAFWDAESVLTKLKQECVDFNSIEQVRDRLIICWRLFPLHRSIDLA